MLLVAFSKYTNRGLDGWIPKLSRPLGWNGWKREEESDRGKEEDPDQDGKEEERETRTKVMEIEKETKKKMEQGGFRGCLRTPVSGRQPDLRLALEFLLTGRLDKNN